MTTIKSYTDLEQSKKLAEILSLESADMCYPLPCEDGDKPLLEQGGLGSTPCWSLAALLDVINQVREIKHQRVTILVGRYANEHWYVEILRVQDERSVFWSIQKNLLMLAMI